MVLVKGLGISVSSLILAVPAFAADRSQGAAPLSNPGEWISTNDYPREALDAQVEGVVGFQVLIDRTGKPTECKITQSSGSTVLDLTACNLITLRGRFSPALDSRGRPAEGSYSSRVRWVAPRHSPPPVFGDLVVGFTVGPDGAVTDCRVEKAEGGAARAASQLDKLCPSSAFGRGYTDSQGRPESRRVRITQRVEVVPVP